MIELTASQKSEIERTREQTEATPGPVYVSSRRWSRERPKTLVVACSDGRLQESLDEFLGRYLGILHYDRLYAPGGPGALASAGYELLRADQLRKELAFLLKAHGTEQVILLFHGSALDGPDEAVCAHYRRVLPYASRPQIVQQQELDAAEVLRQSFIGSPEIRVHTFRAEVQRDNSVQFRAISLDRKGGRGV